MGTVTAPRPARKIDCKFVCGSDSDVIEINSVHYEVDPIDPGERGTQAFRLTKQGGDPATYIVIRRNDGYIACNCPDYCFRQACTATLCKHGRALKELGLLATPTGNAPCSHAG